MTDLQKMIRSLRSHNRRFRLSRKVLGYTTVRYFGIDGVLVEMDFKENGTLLGIYRGYEFGLKVA